MPAVFTERLFVWLSRFCPMRYCIVRHVGFLLGGEHGAVAYRRSPQRSTIIEDENEGRSRAVQWLSARDPGAVSSPGRLLILWGLTPMLAGGLAEADSQTIQTAAWAAHDLRIDLHDLSRRYSCDDLWLKFHDVLLALGARPDLKILTERCDGASRSPSVRLQFSTPELVKRTSTLGTAIDATVATIRLEPGHPASLDDADCELMRQIKDRLLTPMSQHIVSFNLACYLSPSGRGRFNVSMQALQLVSSGARVAEEHDRLPKQLD